MKGTLFSTDFVKDSNGNLRLLEVNTDTAILRAAIDLLDFSGIKTVVESNSITKIKVIHKIFQQDFVDAFQIYVQDNIPGVVDFGRIVEDSNTIYPTPVPAAEDTFILRLAYDESALLDSEYAKNTHNVLNLFSVNNKPDSVVGYYYNGTEGVEDYLTHHINTSNVPDILTKNITTTGGEEIEFYKLGHSNKTHQERFAAATGEFGADKIVVNFYNDESLDKVESYRAVNIVYGDNLDVLDLAVFKSKAVLPKPGVLPIQDENILTKVDVKHYHEITTTHPRFGVGSNYGGIFEEETIIKADGTAVPVKDAVVGDSFKSYFIEGAPDTDVEAVYLAWEHKGQELPSGSYPTTSSLVNNLEVDLYYNMVFNIGLEDGSDFRASGNSHILAYEVATDTIKYVGIFNIVPSEYKLVSAGNGLVNIDYISCEILDGEYSTHILDMETADTYFLGDGQLSIKIVAHNCFPAGTEILLSNGDVKNIEDIVSGDKLTTYNEESKVQEEGIVGNVKLTKSNLLIELILEDGNIKSTPLHRFYVEDKGWIHAQDIVKGDVLRGTENKKVTVSDINQEVGEFDVYHILDVKDNHTYFANNLLVHNTKFGSK